MELIVLLMFQITCKKTNKYFYGTHMNFIINYSEPQENIGLVPYFKSKNLLVSYQYADIFTLLNLDPHIESKKFLSKYENNEVFFPYYKLMDLLSKEKIRTVFCLRETELGLKITKGSKKIVAMAVNNIRLAPILTIGSNLYGEEVKSDIQLFDLLKSLDPTIETVRCDLMDPSHPSIHILENINYVKVWRSLRDSNPRPTV